MGLGKETSPTYHSSELVKDLPLRVSSWTALFELWRPEDVSFSQSHMTENTYDQLYRNCRNIVDTLEADEPDHAATLINDALDIQFIVSINGGYMGAKILVAFGGPNIWIDTQFDQVEGSWGADSITLRFTDMHDIHAHCEDLYRCTDNG